MNVVLWILAGILAVAMLGAGTLKLITPKDGLADKGMELGDLPAGAIKGIGVLEVLGGIGLVVPALVHVAPVLVPWAAVGVAVVMAGAVAFHLRRKEVTGALPAVALLVMALVVAWGRFGNWAF
ncbi:DoxX family protein [Mycolicibacterium sp. P1-18]|uniref:DoxX family protein n=1 Tax=Mycolicibacterium sp. P1-18 TaxID=2024615 RepID=UPI0011F2E3BA|nr:DoxX family protein [Mycolicibacterium sp. P1-18]KAA0097542.1 DoxX family protein [Mycolicibacterium sp. P1-18]